MGKKRREQVTGKSYEKRVATANKAGLLVKLEDVSDKISKELKGWANNSRDSRNRAR